MQYLQVSVSAGTHMHAGCGAKVCEVIFIRFAPELICCAGPSRRLPPPRLKLHLGLADCALTSTPHVHSPGPLHRQRRQLASSVPCPSPDPHSGNLG